MNAAATHEWATKARAAADSAKLVLVHGCSGCAVMAALSPCVCVQRYLSLDSATDTAAALALAWASAIDACSHNAGDSVGVSGQVDSCVAVLNRILVFPDADIMCPFDGRDDASKLAASFILGVTAAASKGIGVVVTSMEQLQLAEFLRLRCDVVIDASQDKSQNTLEAVKLSVPKSFAIPFDHVGGCEQAKKILTQAIVWPLTRIDEMRALGTKPITGIILHGPPGCGKTSLARAVAALAPHVAFFSLSAPEIVHGAVGDSEKALAAVYSKARAAAPSVVFIDEAQAIFASRQDRGRAGQQLSAQFCGELDLCAAAQSGVVTVAATNSLQLLDSAAIRHGRLERCVLVPPPSLAARIDILSRHLAVMCDASVDPSLVAATAASTRGFSGADLENLCRSAGVFTSARGAAVISSDDVAAGLGSVRCSLNSHDVQLATD